MSHKILDRRALALARLAGFALAGFAAAASWAASVPAQVPLISRVANPPTPNVMITIDDSGSMQAHYMPEGNVNVVTTSGTKTVTLPAIASIEDIVDIFPNDGQKRTYSIPPLTIPKGIVEAVVGNTNVFQYQMRSSDINSIFYNPAVLYLPWLTPNASGAIVRMADADYKNAWWNPADTTRGKVDLSASALTPAPAVKWCTSATNCFTDNTIKYNWGLFYVLKKDASGNYTGDPGLTSGYTEYNLNATGNPKFPASAARVCTGYSNCCSAVGATGCSQAQEQQNFANWFVYYRTRTHLAKASLSETLPTVVGKVRIGWGTINTTGQTIDGQTTDVVKQGIRDLDSTQLNTVLTGIQAINPYGSTPLRQATTVVGNYFRRTDSGSPWRSAPGGSDQSQLSCRRSYNLMTTDGYYNDNVSAISVGDVDDVNGPVMTDNPLNATPDHWIAQAPYSETTTHSDTLADFAMKQYVEDLQPGISNKVPQTSDGDLAFWQHLNMFTVGLGVHGVLLPDPAHPGLPILTNGWGTDRIDDLWHAAVDTHGQFFSAKDSTELSTALATALGTASSQKQSESGASISSTTLVANTFKYVPAYKSVAWTGDISAYSLDQNTGVSSPNPTWVASANVPTFPGRTLFTWDGSNSVAWNASMSSTLKNAVDPNSSTQNNLINYIAGDKSNEGSTKSYRARSGPLGDFIDSPPLFVQNFVDLGYDALPTGGTSYRAYIGTKNARTTGVLFEGANDGMLHAFRASDGVELYGYIPNAVLGNLKNLADKSYGSSSLFHQDFVDGPQIETDAYIATKRAGTAWADLVVGSYGAGARGFYALDVTNLSAFDNKTLLWESTAADNDIGYIFSNIAVGVMPNGAWKAFVGNGVDSPNGNAVLLVVDLQTGHIDSRLTLDSTGGNGLMGITLIYDNRKQTVGAYAGDLKGNLWRIELSSGVPVAGFTAGQPLFKAISSNATGNVPQPITIPPVVYPHPNGGNVVLFGTGRLIDTTDAVASSQTFYGVWDKTLSGATSVGAQSPFAGAMVSSTQRTQLIEQTVHAATGNGNFFVVSSNPVDYSQKLGWYMDLDNVGATQRVLYPAQLVNDFVLINTVQPAQPASDPCDPSTGSSAYFLLPALNGAAYAAAPVWDVNGDGSIDQSNNGGTGTGGNTDTVADGSGQSQAAGYRAAGAGETSVMKMPNQDKTYDNVGPSGGREFQTPCLVDCNTPPGSVTVQQRVWKQLMTPPF